MEVCIWDTKRKFTLDIRGKYFRGWNPFNSKNDSLWYLIYYYSLNKKYFLQILINHTFQNITVYVLTVSCCHLLRMLYLLKMSSFVSKLVQAEFKEKALPKINPEKQKKLCYVEQDSSKFQLYKISTNLWMYIFFGL